ncbi:MAG: site-2 protease family protein [Anaerolineales bacterium]|nr:site-2 protease family protein [Anaerolineales bacterium]
MLGLTLPSLITRIVTLVIAFTVHEFAHAWSADQLGDDTPRLNGRLTLNPLAHLDPLGSLMLVVSGFGWAKPVPINPYALRRRTPAGTMLVSIAGPFSNLLMAILAALPFRAGWLDVLATGGRILPSASDFLVQFIFINLILFFFNLIPLAPLDGEKVAEYLLPPRGQDILYRVRPYGPFILIGLLFLGTLGGLNVLGTLVAGPAWRVLSLLVS